MSRPPSILKLSEDNESKEFEFELEYQRSLTFEERQLFLSTGMPGPPLT
jgi:hypothetical protein